MGSINTMHFPYMIIIISLLVMLTIVIIRTQSAKQKQLDIFDPNVENGLLTFLSVTPRPLEPDANGNSYCSYRAQITGPTITPIEIFNRHIRKFNSLWPEVGNQLPVAYIPGKVETTWTFINFEENT